jgi:hypothetical protein
MLDAATLVRSLDNLQAAVLARAAIECCSKKENEKNAACVKK